MGFMAVVRKSLTITEAQDQWIKLQIENGGFTNDSEYLRHLIRQDRERALEVFGIKAALQEGYDSGRSPKLRTVHIMEEAVYRKNARNKGK